MIWLISPALITLCSTIVMAGKMKVIILGITSQSNYSSLEIYAHIFCCELLLLRKKLGNLSGKANKDGKKGSSKGKKGHDRQMITGTAIF